MMPTPLSTIQAKLLSTCLRENSRSLEAQPVDVSPRLAALDGIRAVLFDIYGTLFISGSGDVGTTDVESQPAAFKEALEAIGVSYAGSNEQGVGLLSDTIAAHHAAGRVNGIEYPEVDIRAVWDDVLTELKSRNLFSEDGEVEDTNLLAMEYEVRTNPVWPMPGAADILRQLCDSTLTLGIVSNAQVFTRLLFPTLLDATLDELGFDENLCVWSYEHRQAKPGTFLYERARDELWRRGIAAGEVLFVGNDMLKDVWPASRVGFRTALFAGDSRSYRPRTDDERVKGVHPDLVLTHLAQLPACVVTG